MPYFLNLDFETRATVDLTKVGAYVYARHAMTRVLCARYSLDGGKTIKHWRTWKGQLMPKDLAIALADPECIIVAWNAAFERLILKYVLRMNIAIKRFHCTMARARSMALPGKLGLCAKALEMPVQKADDRVMLKWCKPLKDGGWADDPEEFEELVAYCGIDVATECGIGGLIRDLSVEEWRDYHINEIINDRGIPVDLELARAAQRYAKDELEEICTRLNVITQGAVTSPKQFARVKNWLAQWLPDELYQGLFLDEEGEPKDKVSFDSAAREELLSDDNADILVGDVREFVELIHDGGRASTAKFAAMLARGANEGRVYGSSVFNGAGQTGRFSSTGVQTHNLIRDKLENIELVIEAILSGVSKEQLIDIASYRPDGTFVFDKGKDAFIEEPYNILTILGRTLRPSIVADEGKVFVWSDWKSIEAVVNPWLSRDNSASELLDYFANGGDLYIRQAAMTYGIREEDVGKGQRQAGGKVPVLLSQFGGGVGAILRGARLYGIKNMTEELAEMIKVAWRQANPWAPRFWSALEIAAYQAVREPERVFWAGRVAYMFADSVLWCLLPSGRLLAYPFARISTIVNQFGNEQEVVTCIKGSFHPKKDSNYWPRMKLWGGIQCVGPHTQVLTRKGWTCIIDVGLEPVWDGVEFVEHAGVAYQGWKRVGQLDGVWLTADHKVLTEEGWCEASQCSGLRRAPSGLPSDGSGHRYNRQASHLVGALHLRKNCTGDRQGIDTREQEIVRLQKRRHVNQKQGFAWHDAPSRLRRVALDESALSFADAPSMEKLWRARRHGLQAMAKRFQIFLGRHAAQISAWFGIGSAEQHAGLYTEKLPLDYQTHQCSQPTLPVYDLINCGPRRRFVVRGHAEAAPFIAHNCENVTQAEAASLLRWARRELYDNGWPQVADTHDEALLEVFEEEEDEAKAALHDIMTAGPAYAAGLPMLADTKSGLVYGI